MSGLLNLSIQNTHNEKFKFKDKGLAETDDQWLFIIILYIPMWPISIIYDNDYCHK